MSWTKPTTWMGILILLVIVSVSFMNFANELASRPDTVLNDKSKEYVATFSSNFKDSLTQVSQDNSDLKNTVIIGSDNESGEQSTSDFLATVNLAQERVNPIWSFFETLYNIPTFIFISLRLPVGAFQNIINIFSYILIVALVIVGKKMIIGR